MDKEWVTLGEAAQILSITVETLWAWRKRGVIATVVIGKVKRVAVSDLKDLMDRNKV